MTNTSKTRKSDVIRTDRQFIKEMKEMAKFRYIKNLEKKEPTSSEMTRLLMRTEAWKQVQWELKSKPRRENL